MLIKVRRDVDLHKFATDCSLNGIFSLVLTYFTATNQNNAARVCLLYNNTTLKSKWRPPFCHNKVGEKRDACSYTYRMSFVTQRKNS